MNIFKLIASVAALLLSAGMAHATDTTFVPQSASTCAAQPSSTWSGWGFDPYAANEAEALSDAKLDKALKDAVDAGCMPTVVAESLKAAIRSNPNGTTGDGQPTVIPPGYHFDMMESGHGPMWNVTVGRREVALGQVRAVEAKLWSVQYEGRIYLWFLPAPCRNYALETITAVPPAHPDCVEILVPAKAGDSVSYSRYGEFQPSDCDAFAGPGETAWHPQPTHCPEQECVPLPTVNGFRVVQSGGWRVQGQGGWYRLRISREAAQHGLVYFCLRNGERQTCGVKVQRTDFVDGRATIHYSRESTLVDLATAPPSGAELKFWDFNLRNCREQ